MGGYLEGGLNVHEEGTPIALRQHAPLHKSAVHLIVLSNAKRQGNNGAVYVST